MKRRTFTPSLSAEWWRALKISGRWVHTTNRVNLDSIQVEGKSFRLEMRMRPDLNDLDPDEKEERFQKMRSAMLQTFQGTQWMQGDRSYMQL